MDCGDDRAAVAERLASLTRGPGRELHVIFFRTYTNTYEADQKCNKSTQQFTRPWHIHT